ncbi:hypothetical protein [Thermoactinospora rubra]|uniref:hypothetical protein n=1 Tax=Thermoactinospora rubra TaxID=1088767 RepID=UPI00146FAF8D|nr:hypothetical protein [Thermoactinospora rubra]
MRRPSAGRVLAVSSVLPALAVAGWLLAGLPLLLLGAFRPLPAFALGLAAIALLAWAALRRTPGKPDMPETLDATAGQVAAVFAVAAGSGLFNALLHSEQLIVRRDPATYAQYAIWIAEHGGLPIPRQEDAFGGPDPALVFGSVGFFERPEGVVPQFMPGPPLLFAAGQWLGGLLVSPAVLGALAVLVVAGVVARLAGARWAVPAAAAFAVSLPVLYTSRTTFSEIPSLILLLGGLALLHDARDRTRVALAGLVFGLAVLVRVDGLRDVLPVLAYAGLLLALGRVRRSGPGTGIALLGGLTLGAGLGFLAAYLLAGPYLSYLSRSVVPLLWICAAVLALTVLGTALAPRLARLRPPKRLPELAAAGVVLLMAGFAVRPWVQQVHREPVTPEDVLTADFIEQIQRANGLPVDGRRLYFEDSLYWVVWYVGVPVVVLATVAAAVLVRRLLRDGASFEWLLPLAVVGWTTVTTLLRPEITPDHPWASRRLVPVVVPGLIALAVWGLAWARDKARRMGYGTRHQKALAALGVTLILVPGAVTSIGTAFTPVGRGEPAAVRAMCARIPANASVLIVERVTGDRLTQVVRGMCGVPAAKVRRREGADVPPREEVTRLIGRVRSAGRVPVLLAAEAWQLSPYGTPQQVMALATRQDGRYLTKPPSGTWRLGVTVWMCRPQP